MILNAALCPFEGQDFQSGKAITAEVDIEGRSWVHASFRLSGFADRVTLPEWSDSLASVRSRHVAEYASAFLGERNG